MISFGLCIASYYIHGGSTSIPANIVPGPLMAATGAFSAPPSNSPNTLEPRGITLPPLGCVSVVIIVALAAVRTIINIRSLAQLRFKGRAEDDPEAYCYRDNTTATATGHDAFLSSVRTSGDDLQGLAPEDASSTTGPTSETDQL